MNDLAALAYPWPFDDDPAGRKYVIIVGIARDGRVALVRVSEDGRSWELPGGMIEEGESAEQAAAREFREETGWRLEGAVKAARIDNVTEDGRMLHSQAFLVTGSFEETESMVSADGEVKERAVMDSAPQDSTFGKAWTNDLIKLGRNRLTSNVNQQMWSCAASNYDDQTEISERDVHYGPLIPGESALRLLPSVANFRVLDLGCGAGHNLAALAHMGASGGLGIDFSAEQVKRGRARVPAGFQITEADITVHNFADAGPFDLVLSVFAVSFVADLAALIKIAARSLRPGGILLLSTDHPCRLLSGQGGGFTEPKRPSAGVRRLWTFPGLPLMPFFQYLHDLPTIVSAVAGAGLFVDAMREPRALPVDDLASAPYGSSYYLSRHDELSQAPYTLILRARKLRS